MEIKIGQKSPEFCLKDQNNKDTSLSDFKNKWIILYFYPKDNTSGCTKEAIDFTKNIEKIKKLNAVVIGISPDKDHTKFIKKHSLDLVLLSDPEHGILKKYGVWQQKSMYGIKFMGVVRTTFLINPKEKIAHIWEKVKVDNHVNEVKSKLKELQNI